MTLFRAFREKKKKEKKAFAVFSLVRMNGKIKPVLPSLREKKRYLVFEVISKQKIQNFKEVSQAIQNSALMFLGQLGMAKAGTIILKDKWNKDMQRGIIKVNHKEVDNLRAALTFTERIEGKEVIVRSVGVSGILKKAENKYLKPVKTNN
jgi:ribonuclease P/MRP protein subunit POP5